MKKECMKKKLRVASNATLLSSLIQLFWVGRLQQRVWITFTGCSTNSNRLSKTLQKWDEKVKKKYDVCKEVLKTRGKMSICFLQ